MVQHVEVRAVTRGSSVVVDNLREVKGSKELTYDLDFGHVAVGDRVVKSIQLRNLANTSVNVGMSAPDHEGVFTALTAFRPTGPARRPRGQARVPARPMPLLLRDHLAENVAADDSDRRARRRDLPGARRDARGRRRLRRRRPWRLQEHHADTHEPHRVSPALARGDSRRGFPREHLAFSVYVFSKRRRYSGE